MNKNLKAVLISTTCGFLFCTSPINASEANNTLSSASESSLVNAIKENFDVELTNLTYTKEQGEAYYFETKNYEVVVEGYDESEENQTVKASLYSKTANEILEDEGLQTTSIKTEKIKVKSEDDTAPVIEAQDVYETSLNTEVNLKKNIKVSDDTDTKVDTTITGDVDYSKEGTYTVTISATDDSGNTSQKQISIKVTDPDFYQKIADAAMAQIGVEQDCTMLVTNSLAAVGIDFHGSPEEYLTLGELTDNPVPGDICVYNGHVAIYVGDGNAVHGGWDGYTTAVSSVDCPNGLIGYVHVTH